MSTLWMPWTTRVDILFGLRVQRVCQLFELYVQVLQTSFGFLGWLPQMTHMCWVTSRIPWHCGCQLSLTSPSYMQSYCQRSYLQHQTTWVAKRTLNFTYSGMSRRVAGYWMWALAMASTFWVVAWRPSASIQWPRYSINFCRKAHCSDSMVL